MKKTTLLLVATAIISGAFASAAFAQANNDEFFENKIRPLLVEACYGSHTRSRLGGLRVDSREALLEGGESGAAIVPGDAEASRLILAVRHTDPALEMPKAARTLHDGGLERDGRARVGAGGAR